MAVTECSYIYVDWKIHYIEASLSYEEWQEDGCWVARCPELQLSDYGETKKEAVNNLSDMILSVLVSATEKGNLDAMLKKVGFKSRKVPAPKRKYYNQTIELTDNIYPLPDLKAYFDKSFNLIPAV